MEIARFVCVALSGVVDARCSCQRPQPRNGSDLAIEMASLESAALDGLRFIVLMSKTISVNRQWSRH